MLGLKLNHVSKRGPSSMGSWFPGSHLKYYFYFFVLLNTLRPKQNGRRVADDTFERIFVSENVRISIKISPKFIPKGPINNIPALVRIMVWRRPGNKPLSEPMMVRLPTHVCVTQPQLFNHVMIVVLYAWLWWPIYFYETLIDVKISSFVCGPKAILFFYLPISLYIIENNL